MKYQHDCDKCRFLGHFADHDVYICSGGIMGDSIIARYGDDGPDYSSSPISLLQDQIKYKSVEVGGETVLWKNYVLTSKIYQAMVLGMAVR